MTVGIGSGDLLVDATAVVMEGSERLSVARLAVSDPEPADIVVDMRWSGISTGTERLLYTGRMPAFPGMGYPGGIFRGVRRF